MPDAQPPTDSSTNSPAQFGLKGLMLSVVAFCVLAAVATVMFRRPDTPPRGVLVLLPVFAPVALMIVLGLVYSAGRLLVRLRRKSRSGVPPLHNQQRGIPPLHNQQP